MLIGLELGPSIHAFDTLQERYSKLVKVCVVLCLILCHGIGLAITEYPTRCAVSV